MLNALDKHLLISFSKRRTLSAISVPFNPFKVRTIGILCAGVLSDLRMLTKYLVLTPYLRLYISFLDEASSAAALSSSNFALTIGSSKHPIVVLNPNVSSTIRGERIRICTLG